MLLAGVAAMVAVSAVPWRVACDDDTTFDDAIAAACGTAIVR